MSRKKMSLEERIRRLNEIEAELPLSTPLPEEIEEAKQFLREHPEAATGKKRKGKPSGRMEESGSGIRCYRMINSGRTGTLVGATELGKDG